ncbi:MAG: HesA/MoeB/ThiF family protein [Beijerinckiaceae bacterium]
MFSAEEVERYARHLVLRDVGGPGQQKLKAARVLVIGAGGLGAPLLQYLAAAGVGELGIVDDDKVSLSNLQRQILFATADVGRPKVEAAGEALARLNPHVEITPFPLRLTKENVARLVSGWTLVVDGSDNFETRYVTSDACFFAARPLVTGAVGSFDASLTTLRPFEKTADGTPNPTYRCLFPEPPPPGTVPACAEAGVLGALTGILGALMGLEAIREIVGFGENLVGRLLLIDALTMRFETIRYQWDPANPLNGSGQRVGSGQRIAP